MGDVGIFEYILFSIISLGNPPEMGSLGRFAKNWGSRHSCEDKMIAHPVVMALLHEWLLPNYLLTAAQAWGMARFFPTIFKTCLEGFGPSP